MIVSMSVAAMIATTQPAPAQPTPPPEAHAQLPPGASDFAFQFGSWRVHHRVRRAGQTAWLEFEGDCTDRPIMGGLANIEDNVFHKPDGVTRGVALRAFDPASGDWAIWWVDGRNPLGALDPPMRGRFVDGVGTFYSDGEMNGRPMRTRFIWSHITANSARWEQAFSFDAGQTWDTNWIMDFTRVGA